MKTKQTVINKVVRLGKELEELNKSVMHYNKLLAECKEDKKSQTGALQGEKLDLLIDAVVENLAKYKSSREEKIAEMKKELLES